MTREQALAILEEAMAIYLEGNQGVCDPRDLAEIALTHCESMINMIPVSSRNTFWNITYGRYVDPNVEPWDEWEEENTRCVYSLKKNW